MWSKRLLVVLCVVCIMWAGCATLGKMGDWLTTPVTTTVTPPLEGSEGASPLDILKGIVSGLPLPYTALVVALIGLAQSLIKSRQKTGTIGQLTDGLSAVANTIAELKASNPAFQTAWTDTITKVLAGTNLSKDDLKALVEPLIEPVAVAPEKPTTITESI